GDRHRRLERTDVDGHDDAAASQHLVALQVAAVRHGRWLAPHRPFADHEFRMTEQFAIDVARNAFVVALQIGGPLPAGSLVVGMLVSVFQAVTQINESTLSFVPKILVVAGGLAVLGPSMATTLVACMWRTYVLLAQFAALLLVPVLGHDGIPAGMDVTWTALASEALVGALAGFASTVAYSAIQFGASLLDVQAGFSMASIYDATLGSQGATLERFYS